MTKKRYLDLGIKLIKSGDLENAITAFCLAIKLDSKYTPAYNNLGLVLKKTNRLHEAEACFYRAIELKPRNAHTYNNLGLVLMDLRNLCMAEQIFRKAIELNPNSSIIYNNLGTVLEENGQLAEAEEAYRRSIELNQIFPEAHYNLGRLMGITKNLKEAEAYLCRAVELRPDYWEADLYLANLYLLQEKYQVGWEKFEKMRKKRYGDSYFKAPYWNGENLAQYNILLYWEYGFGDTIQFARYAGKIEKLAKKTILWVQKPLERLIAAEYPNLTIYTGDCPPQEHFDYVCSLISLPLIFNTCKKTIPQTVPYRLAGCIASITWRNVLEKINNGTSYKVGVAWAAGDPKRSIPFNVFHKLFNISGVSWISLQVGVSSEDLIGTSDNIVSFSEKFVDFLDTAELIKPLDLVITVDTSVAHLAGTMGKRTWVLLPFAPDWRWQLDREDSPWYPTIRLFRQHMLGDWQEVIERARKTLQKELK